MLVENVLLLNHQYDLTKNVNIRKFLEKCVKVISRVNEISIHRFNIHIILFKVSNSSLNH